jgi:hypothetical protein
MSLAARFKAPVPPLLTGRMPEMPEVKDTAALYRAPPVVEKTGRF